jgi:hypothetical protein
MAVMLRRLAGGVNVRDDLATIVANHLQVAIPPA